MMPGSSVTLGGSERTVASCRQCMAAMPTGANWPRTCRPAPAQHPAPRMLPLEVPRHIQAQAGRPRKSQTQPLEDGTDATPDSLNQPSSPPPEEPPAKPVKTRRPRASKATTQPLQEQHPSQPASSSPPPGEEEPPVKPVRRRTRTSKTAMQETPLPEAVAEQATLPLSVSQDTLAMAVEGTVGGLGLVVASDLGPSEVQGVEEAQVDQPSAAAVAQPAAEEPDGSFGVTSGLEYDSYEKTTLRELVGHDVYQLRRNIVDMEELPENTVLPRQYLPVTNSTREQANIKFHMSREYWQARADEQEYVHDLAWQSHHNSRRNAVNVYANTRRVAGLMTAFENDDFKLQNLAPSSIAPWARSEIVFSSEHDAFNKMLRDNTENMTKRMPKEAQDEELDLLDEALFLLRPDDDNAAADRADQQSAEQELQDLYLDGMLPGATLDNLAASYADDIFAADSDGYASHDEDSFKAAPVEGAAAKPKAAEEPVEEA